MRQPNCIFRRCSGETSQGSYSRYYLPEGDIRPMSKAGARVSVRLPLISPLEAAYPSNKRLARKARFEKPELHHPRMHEKEQRNTSANQNTGAKRRKTSGKKRHAPEASQQIRGIRPHGVLHRVEVRANPLSQRNHGLNDHDRRRVISKTESTDRTSGYRPFVKLSDHVCASSENASAAKEPPESTARKQTAARRR